MTEQQCMFVHYHVHERLPVIAAARNAGYSAMQGYQLVKNPKIIAAIAAARQEYADAARIDRVEVITGFKEAIELARVNGEPMSMIAGWREIGKMCGLYEPEKRSVEISGQVRVSTDKMKTMSDEQLMMLAYDKNVVIEGEFKDVTGPDEAADRKAAGPKDARKTKPA